MLARGASLICHCNNGNPPTHPNFHGASPEQPRGSTQSCTDLRKRQTAYPPDHSFSRKLAPASRSPVLALAASVNADPVDFGCATIVTACAPFAPRAVYAEAQVMRLAAVPKVDRVAGARALLTSAVPATCSITRAGNAEAEERRCPERLRGILHHLHADRPARLRAERPIFHQRRQRVARRLWHRYAVH